MTLNINENKKKALTSLIRDQHAEHLSRFPFAKYPVEPLNDWRDRFTNPKMVGPDTQQLALSWQCGSWQKRDKQGI